MKVWRAWVAAEFRRAAWAMPWLIGAHLLAVGASTRWVWDLSDRMRWLIGLAQLGLSLWVVVISLWECAPLPRKRFLATRPHSFPVIAVSKAVGLWLIAVLPFVLVETVVGLYHDMPWRTVMLGMAQTSLLGTAGLAAAFPALWWWKRWPEAVVGLVVGLPLALAGAAMAYGKWWFPGVPLWPVAVLGGCGLFALAGWIGLGMGRFGWWARIGLFPPFVWLCMIGGLELGFIPPPVDETVEVSLARVEAAESLVSGGGAGDVRRERALKISVPSYPVGDLIERRWSERGSHDQHDGWFGERGSLERRLALRQYFGRRLEMIDGNRTYSSDRGSQSLIVSLPHSSDQAVSVKPDVSAVETRLIWEVVADIPVREGGAASKPGETWTVHGVPASGEVLGFTVRHTCGSAWLDSVREDRYCSNKPEKYYLYDPKYSEVWQMMSNHGPRGWMPWKGCSIIRSEKVGFDTTQSDLPTGRAGVDGGYRLPPSARLDLSVGNGIRLLVMRPRTVKRIAHFWKSPEEVVLDRNVPETERPDGCVFVARSPEAGLTAWLSANPPPVSWCSDKLAARWLDGIFRLADAERDNPYFQASWDGKGAVYQMRRAERLRGAEQAVGRLVAEHPVEGLRLLARFKREIWLRKLVKDKLANRLTREVVMAVPESHTDPFVAGTAVRKGFFRDIAPAITRRVRGGAWGDLTDVIERVPTEIGLTEGEWLDYFRLRPLGSVYLALRGTVVRKETLAAEAEKILRNWTDSRVLGDPVELPDLALAVGRPEAPAWVAAHLADYDDAMRLAHLLCPMISRYFDVPVTRDPFGYQDAADVRWWFLSCDPSGFVFNPKRVKYELPTPE